MDIPFITYTNSKVDYIWNMYFGQLDMYFDDIQSYVLSDKYTDRYCNHKFIQYDNNSEYWKQWIDALENIDTEYFIYMQEDFVLYDKPNIDELDRCVRFLTENDKYSYVKLIRCGNTIGENVEKNLTEILPESCHFFSMQPTIWRKDVFVEMYTRARHSKWYMETTDKASTAFREMNLVGLYYYDNEPKRGKSHWDSSIFPYTATALVKGEWNFSEYKQELSELLGKYEKRV